MIELIKGCKISGIENIKEEYKIEKTGYSQM